MAEYWNINTSFEDRVKNFLKDQVAPAISLEFEVIKHDFNNAGNGSAELKRFLKKIGIDPIILRKVAVASYEAEINLAAHSEGGIMKSHIHSDCVHIIFEDKGPGIEDINKALEPGYSTAVEYVREMGFGAGLGLPNIKKNSDVMHLDSERGKSTKLEIITFFK